MKRVRLPFVILVILCAVIWFGCGDDDDDDDNNNDTGNNVEIVGTWKLVSADALVGVIGAVPEATLTVKSDNTWSSEVTGEVPGIGSYTVTSEGTYTISGNQVTGKTTQRNVETSFSVPGFNLPETTSFGLTGEVTVERDGDRLTVITPDETAGQIAAIFEKQ
ncbi:MAG: lipocalin family protein [Candidatus Poribacteria bacterium]|nr:lipocalin family protein [Candidatus Poribacteria bacterium]